MMPPIMADLLTLARAAAEKAYAPYSRFQVGCALETAAGHLYTGCNVENASYGLTVCAERAAIFQAVAAEGPGMRLRRLAVVCLGQEFPPCGACRQVMAEFALPGDETEILFQQAGRPVCFSMPQLLPASFGLEAGRLFPPLD